MLLNKKHKLLLLTFLSVVLLTVILHVSFAQVANQTSRQIDISAYVLGKDDLELNNGEYSVRFAIYSRDRQTADPYPSNSDAKIWEETQEVEINKGLLNAYLGAVKSLPENLDFSSNNYYLGIRIGTDSEMVPRKKIAAIPLAINAFSLQGATPGTKEGNILQLGKGGKILETILPELTTLGTVDTGAWEADPITSEFIDAALSGKTYDGLTLTSNADGFSITGGSTSRKLTVVGGDTTLNAPGSAGSIAYSDGTGYAFSTSGTAGQVLISGGAGAPTWGAVAGGSSQWIDDANGIHYLAGNVGIGTDLPEAYLQIKAGTATVGTAPLKLTSGTNLTTAEAGAFEYDGTELYFTPSGTTRETIAYLSDMPDPSQWTTTGSDIYYDAGKVGIGTNVPGEALDVDGNINISSGSYYKYNGVNFGMANTAKWNYFSMGAGNLDMYGSYNTASGFESLSSADSLFNNTAYGYRALKNNAIASDNSAFGYNALTANTTGINNVAVGSGAMSSNISGSGNVAVGPGALQLGTISGGNVAVGSLALNHNNGTGNTAVGSGTLWANTTGVENTAIGDMALYNNITGISNIGIGDYALVANTTGHQNVSMGNSALMTIADGYQNLALGTSALSLVTDGDYNVAVGAEAMYYTATSFNNTAVGQGAGRGVNGQSNSNNSSFGYHSGYGLSTGSNNILLGYQAGDNITTGSNNIVIGYDINATSATGSNQLNIGNSIYGDLSVGSIGIGDATPEAYLQIKAGTATAGTAPLKLTSGTNMTTAEAGAFEYDGAELYFTPSGTTRETIAYLSDIPAPSQWTTAGADIYYTIGNVGIGIASPGSTLDVAGIIRATSGANYLEMYHNGTDAVISTSSGEILIGAGGDFVLDSGVNLGVGTASPSSIVDIEKQGTAKADSDLLEITNSGNAADMDATLSSILFNQWYYDASAPAVADAGKISFGTETDWTSTADDQDSYLSFSTALDGTVAEKMRITSGGNVGIGNTAPSTKLHVRLSDGALTNVTDSNAIAVFDNPGGNAANVHLNLPSGVGFLGNYYFTVDGATYEAGMRYDVDNDYLALMVDGDNPGTEPFVLKAGNVGIGDTAPDNLLEIMSSGAANTQFTVSNTNAGDFNPQIGFELADGTNLFTMGVDDSDSDKFKIYSGASITGTSEFVIDSTGLVSIANLEMGAQTFADDSGIVSWIDMGVTSGATAGTVESYTAQLDGNNILTIYGLSDGAGGVSNLGVGIGTTAPANPLDVKRDASSWMRMASFYDVAADGIPYINIGPLSDSDGIIMGYDNTGGFGWISHGGLDPTGGAGLIVASTGNIGIGITAPTALLHLAGAAGMVSLEINSNETTAGSNVLAVRSDVASDDDMIFRVQADGAVFADGAYTGTGADYAEYFETTDTDLRPGEAVCLDPEKENAVKRCMNSGDNNVMGIISSNPSIVGNSADGREKDPRYKIVAMLGQIRGNVSAKDNPIQIGDSLTADVIPGYLRKAQPGESTVGVALQNFSGEKGMIQVLISRKNKSLTVEKVEEAVSLRIAEMNVQDQVDSLIAEARTGLDEAILTLSSGVDAKILDLTAIIEAQIDEIRADNRTNLDLISRNSSDINTLTAQMASILGEGPETIATRLKNLEILSQLSSRNLENGGLEITIVDPAAPTIGKGAIPEDKSIKFVETKAVTADSKIYVTPIGSTDNQVIYVGAVEEASGFEVKVDRLETVAVPSEIKFNWWIVESR